MKRKSRLTYLKIAAVVAALSIGVSAYAETPREELVHAYWLLRTSNQDYKGHRGAALHAVEAAGHELGLQLKGGVPEREQQWKSDDQLKEAQRLLRDARDKLEEHDRTRVAEHVDNAVRDIDAALRVK
jgi:hypothetical protein